MSDIPDEAVQAAKDACYEVTGNRITTPGLVEAMLEAALPHLSPDPWAHADVPELFARIRELEEQKATLIRALEAEQNAARGAQLNAGVRAEGLTELLERIRDE